MSSGLQDLWGGCRGLLHYVLWTLVATIAVVCCADLYRSLPWTDHCVGHHICSLLAQFSFVDLCFGRLLCQFCPQPPSHPHRKWLMVGIWSGKSPLKLLQCDGAGWWPLAGLVPAHRVSMETVPGICTGPLPTLDGASFQAHQLAMSLNRNILMFSPCD